MAAGDVFVIETPGGGGFGAPEQVSDDFRRGAVDIAPNVARDPALTRRA